MRLSPGITLAELNAALAIDDVELDADGYVIETPPAAPRRSVGIIRVGDRKLTGAGMGQTTIRFTGDVGGRDWWGIELASGTVQGLTIDTSAVTGAIEQMHCVRVNGPANAPVIDSVEFIHPNGGDGIQFVGYAGSLIANPRVRNCRFTLCARSGVAAHSGVVDIRMSDDEFVDCGGQDIDCEGSGGHRDWLIERCRFRLGAHPRSGYGIQFHLIDGAELVDCTLDRGVYVLNGNSVKMERCRIYQTITGAPGVIEIDKASAGCSVVGCTVVRAQSAGAGTVIRTMPRDGRAPSGLTIEDTTLVQGAPGSIIDAMGVVDLLVDRTTMIGVTGGYGVLAQGAVGIRCDRVTVSGCVFAGQLAGCIGTSGSYGGAGTFALTGNYAQGPRNGIVVGDRFAGSIYDSDNYWPPPVGWSPP